jgi:hypothetical protein
MRDAARLQPARDAAAADWLVGRLGPFASGVGALVPHGFEAYARILHPAVDLARRPIRWGEIAAWSGQTVHPLVQFERLMQPAAGHGDSPRPWAAYPPTGNLPGPTLAALCEILGRHTTSPAKCRFCLWEGYGWIQGSPTGFWLTSDGRGAPMPPAFGAEILAGPRVRLPERNYMLFEGPLDAASEMGERPAERTFVPQSPNLFWPDDRAWCVASEIDLDSTYVGGSTAMIAELLAEPALEAFPAKVTDDQSMASDEINR